jgi:hypothetical protein
MGKIEQALIAAVILLVFCALLVAFMRQRRRLVALQTQLDSATTDFRRLEAVNGDLLVHSMNLRRRRKARKSSGPSSGTLEASPLAPKQADKKSKAALYAVAPKTSPE